MTGRGDERFASGGIVPKSKVVLHEGERVIPLRSAVCPKPPRWIVDGDWQYWTCDLDCPFQHPWG